MDGLFQMWWPVWCIVIADIIYQVCAKKISANADPLAALGVTYLVSAAVCAILFLLLGGENLAGELMHVQTAAVGIGLSVTGLEVGSVLMYKAGWAMNVGFILYTAMIVVVLILLGLLFYGEVLTMGQTAGVFIASAGMYLIVRGKS